LQIIDAIFPLNINNIIFSQFHGPFFSLSVTRSLQIVPCCKRDYHFWKISS